MENKEMMDKKEEIKDINTEETGDKSKDKQEDKQESSAVDSTKKEKLFTQEEINDIISKRLERERKKAEEERQEAERLAKMSEAERQQELFNKEQEKFEKERQEFKRQQMELQVTKELNTKGLPVEFASYLIAGDAESCMNNIKTFEEKWTNALEEAVKERIKGGYEPPTGKTDDTDPFLKGLMG